MTNTGDVFGPLASPQRHPLATLLKRLDARCPVPFDLVSPDGCHSRVLAVLAFGGLTLRAYRVVLARSFGDGVLPRCAPHVPFSQGALTELVGSLGSLWQALPFACVLGLANSRWHGASWRLVALPYAAALLAESSFELLYCAQWPQASGGAGGASRGRPVRQLVAQLLLAVDVLIFLGVLLRLLRLLHTGSARGTAGAALRGAISPAQRSGALESGRAVRAADGTAGRLVPLRLWVGLWLSLTVVLLLCAAQLRLGMLLWVDGPSAVLRLGETVRRAEAQLRASGGDAQWLAGLLAEAQRLLSACALPAAAALGPSVAAGALAGLCNDVCCKAIAVRRCRRLVLELGALALPAGRGARPPSPAAHASPGAGRSLQQAEEQAEQAEQAERGRESALRSLAGEGTAQLPSVGAPGVPFAGGTPPLAASESAAVGPLGSAPACGERPEHGSAEGGVDSRAQLPRSVDLSPFSAYWAFYLIPISVANSAVAYALLSAACTLLAFSLACAPVRQRLWTSWLTLGYVSALGLDYCLRRALFQRLLATRHSPRLPRLFRLADFAYSFTLGPVAGTSSVGCRLLCGCGCALAGLARIDVPLLPRSVSTWDPAFAAWQAMLKLHVVPTDGCAAEGAAAEPRWLPPPPTHAGRPAPADAGVQRRGQPHGLARLREPLLTLAQDGA